MLSKVYAAGIRGVDGFIVCCECDVSSGLPVLNIIGSITTEIKEAQERVRTALKNAGFELLPKRIIVNLSPANIRKESCAYDLAIAISIISSFGILENAVLKDTLFIGELSLGGDILPVRGILAILMCARKEGFQRVFIPHANYREGSAIHDMEIYGVDNLAQVVRILKKEEEPVNPIYHDNEEEYYETESDFADIKGQSLIKRASIIAVAGKHNILYIGPAGTGKSMIASRIPSIMPRMTLEESLEISGIYSICGKLNDRGLLQKRPFRSPHHTISKQALIGGGAVPKPGEVSLSTHGVLFLDEFAEFKNEVIEVLRQPMEDKKVSIARVRDTYTFPADFMLCVATNPCKCGFYPDRSKCKCNEVQVKNYLGKISKPMIDRIDICVETRLLKYEELHSAKEEQTSAQIRVEIERVRQIQAARFQDSHIRYNADMNKKMIDKFCKLQKEDEIFLQQLYEKRNMSVRAIHKILKVARTIADYENRENIIREDICEAISYRSLEDKYWGN